MLAWRWRSFVVGRRHFQLQPVRAYGDRGGTRRDYSDPGYHKLGYISESSFSATHRSRFKKRHSGEIPPPCPRLGDPYIGSISRADYLHRNRKLGDARRQYEEQRRAEGKESLLDLPEPVEEQEQRRLDDPEPSSEVKYEPLPFRPLKKKKGKTSPLSRKRGFKGLLQDFTQYRFPWSRLDEFTKRLAARRRKR